jgi:hypothetical protein
MSAKAAYNPETHHSRTGARRTTTPETATARPGPTPAQIQAEQQRTTTEHIDKHGNVVQTSAPLPVPLELTDKQRQENLARNMAAVGVRAMTYIIFEGVKNVYQIDGQELPAGGLYVCLVRQTELGFRRFNGPGTPPDLMMRRIDEPQYGRDDLDNGYEEEDSEYGRRFRWSELIVLPMIDANNGGGELFAFEARNITSVMAARNLIGRCHRHPSFKKGLSPIIALEVGSYKHPKYGIRGKPVLKICGWARPDGTTITEPQPPRLPLSGNTPTPSGEFNDTIPY